VKREPFVTKRARILNLLHGALLLALAFSLFHSATPTAAQQANPLTLTLRAGFEGYYKDGRWMPVRVSVANDGADVVGSLRVIVPRNDGTDVTYARNVDLPTQSRRELYLYLPMEGYASQIALVLVNAQGKELAKATARVTQATATDLVYGIVAGSPSAFNVLNLLDPIGGSAYTAQLELADLPPVDQGWQALDVLILSDVDTGALSSEQRAALSSWISNGGRLIVAGGPGWQKTAAGLSEILPLRPTGSQTISDFSGLAAYTAEALEAANGVIATGTLAPDATTWVSVGEALPLITSRQQGFGQVVYLAADPAFAPLKNWDGLEALFRNLMSATLDRPSWAGGMRNWYSARDAINALPGLNLPATWQICGFLGLYIVVIGPLNYLVLRVLKRRELAWVTIPGIVVVFSVGTYLTGYQLRGTEATLHRLAVVQVWPGSEWARADEVVGLFSPRRTGYDLEFAEGVLARPMPSDGSYGAPAAETVLQSDTTRVEDVRVDVGAVQAFITQGKIPAPEFSSALTLDIGGSAPALKGSITNNSNLTLKNAVLLVPGTSQTLGDLAPGETEQISLFLFTSRANPAPTGAVVPSFSGLTSGYYPPSTYDRTIDEILGNSNYYNDKNAYRRYSLLSSIMDPYAGSARGSGIYLVGWTDDAPLAVTVNRSFSTIDQSVYFIALQPQVNQASGTITLPPGLMNWSVLDPGQTGSPTPYDMYLYQGYEYALRFMPAQPLTYNQVKSLTLNMASYGTVGLTGLNVFLWDFAEGAWVERASTSWGGNLITIPEKFVSPAGEIHVRVENPSLAQLSLEAIDFTLVVER
jgi:hypothetical protein